MENIDENKDAGPSIIGTPIFMISKKSFIIPLSNNKSEFSINIEFNGSNLSLFLNQIENPNLSFKKSYTLEELKKISKVFAFHEELSEVFGYLSEMLNNKEITLNSDDNQNLNNLYLSFSFELPYPKKKEVVKLYLDKFEMSTEEEAKMIKKELFQLKKEIKELKEENKNLKKQLENNTQNNNNSNNNINFEEIINALIDEKFKNINNNNKNNEAEIQNINTIINMTNDEYNNKFKNIKDNINNINSKLFKIENDDLINLKKSTTDELESLKSIINTNNEDIQQLSNRMNSSKIVDQLIDDDKRQNQEIANLNTVVNQINEMNQEEFQSLKLLVNELSNTNPYGFGNIINNAKKENDITQLIKIIKQKIPEFNNKEIQAKLLYNSWKDGGDCKNFHTLCNGIPNTFSLITTTKGVKFGFFRSIAINSNRNWLQDNKSFFISLNKGKIYKIKQDKEAVKFDDTYFINTASFSLTGNIFKDKIPCPNKDSMDQNFEGFTEEFELNCGEKEFYIKKFEVYQLEF